MVTTHFGLLILLWICLLKQCVAINSDREDGSSLVQLYNCTCVGYTQIYKCTVFGGGFTIWQGSAFECNQNPNLIRLRHSEYVTGAMGDCNDGAVMASSVGVSGNFYISILTVTVGQEMVNETIECVHHDTQGESIIDHSVLRISEAPYAPPLNVHVERVEENQLVFAWNKVTFQCPSIRYVITAVNCGICPNATNDTRVFCIHFNTSTHTLYNMCTFAVKTETCGLLLGEKSNIVSLNLVVPSPPDFIVRLHYYSPENVTIEIAFNTSNMAISDNIDGSPSSYNIIFSDFHSGKLCASDTIPASSCQFGLCLHKFDITSSGTCLFSVDISVSISSRNLFGSGPPSQPVVFSLISHESGSEENCVAKCNNSSVSDLVVPVAAALGILLTTTVPAVVACATVNIMLQKKYMSMKEKLQAKLRLDSGIEQLASEFYEEVDITLRASANTVIDTNNNAAYSTVKDLSK